MLAEFQALFPDVDLIDTDPKKLTDPLREYFTSLLSKDKTYLKNLCQSIKDDKGADADLIKKYMSSVSGTKDDLFERILNYVVLGLLAKHVEKVKATCLKKLFKHVQELGKSVKPEWESKAYGNRKVDSAREVIVQDLRDILKCKNKKKDKEKKRKKETESKEPKKKKQKTTTTTTSSTTSTTTTSSASTSGASDQKMATGATSTSTTTTMSATAPHQINVVLYAPSASQVPTATASLAPQATAPTTKIYPVVPPPDASPTITAPTLVPISSTTTTSTMNSAPASSQSLSTVISERNAALQQVQIFKSFVRVLRDDLIKRNNFQTFSLGFEQLQTILNMPDLFK